MIYPVDSAIQRLNNWGRTVIYKYIILFPRKARDQPIGKHPLFETTEKQHEKNIMLVDWPENSAMRDSNVCLTFKTILFNWSWLIVIILFHFLQLMRSLVELRRKLFK